MGYGRTPAPSAENHEYCCCSIPGVKLIGKHQQRERFARKTRYHRAGLKRCNLRDGDIGIIVDCCCARVHTRGRSSPPWNGSLAGGGCSSSRAKQRFARATSRNDFFLPRKNATRCTVYIILQVSIPPTRFTSLFLWHIRIRGSFPKAVRSCFWGRGKRFRGNE